MDGLDIVAKVERLRSRLESYDVKSDDGPLVTLLERVLDLIEDAGESIDGLENRFDVLKKAVEGD